MKVCFLNKQPKIYSLFFHNKLARCVMTTFLTVEAVSLVPYCGKLFMHCKSLFSFQMKRARCEEVYAGWPTAALLADSIVCRPAAQLALFPV